MKTSDLLPLVEELTPPPEPESVFRRMASLTHCLFLDSALRHPTLGRYSFVAADPFEFLQIPADGGDALSELSRRMQPFTACRRSDLPPFQGGAAGLLSYDLGRSLETMPTPRQDEFQTPALAIGFYDTVVAWDHATGRAWIISQGFPETDLQCRHRRAAERIAQIRDVILNPLHNVILSEAKNLGRNNRSFASLSMTNNTLDIIGNLDQQNLAPQFSVDGLTGVTSSFSKQGYLDAVRRVIDYIYAGDVFQVNLAQRLLAPARDDSVSLYQRLRQRNPATMAGYFDLGDFQVLSASPERFLRVADRCVETRPIKGTRPRLGDPTADRAAEVELLSSEKDRAENVMIVDLLRNDLARACEADSIRVSQLCGVEACQYVLHLVSAVEGRLRRDCTPIDLIRATFPGGSITGAPKVRAMEIIAELEPTARGAYCGALGYLGFDGSLDLNLLIRTITAGRGWLQFPVGGGIVAQSDPEREYEETWHKAEGILQALEE